MTWPPKIPKVPKPLDVFFREIIARVDASWPVDGFGIKCTDTKHGRSINAGASTGSGASDTHPLDLLTAAEGFRIVYGTVAGLSDPFSPGDSPNYTLEVTNGHKVYARLTMNYNTGTGVWTATVLAFAAAATVPAADATNAYFEIGSVSSEGIPASAVNGSVAHKRCGDDENFQDYFVG